VNRCPARELLQLLQVKQSLCHGSFLYVTPPLVMICDRESVRDAFDNEARHHDALYRENDPARYVKLGISEQVSILFLALM